MAGVKLDLLDTDVAAARRAAQSRQTRIEHFMRSPAYLKASLDKDLAEDSLLDYARLMWPVVEPKRPMKLGWAIEAICEHLEAVTNGDIRRLLINVPPGLMKSLLTDVFWPSWEWGPRRMSDMRYISASYIDKIPIRDMLKGRRIINSDMYQALWGDEFTWDTSQNAKTRYDNDKQGFRIATSVGGLSTGERGDRFIIDDPHNVKTAESENKLEDVAQWITEVVPTRVNDQELSAFVTIMQRVHESDASGVLLSADLGYVHLELPMELEEGRRCGTIVKSQFHSPGGRTFYDPRTKEGELLFPELFSPKGVEDLKKALSSWGGEYAVAGQLQQRPAPRGGGMFKTEREAGEMYVDHAPEGGHVCRGWDIAGSTRKKSPFTVGLKLKKVRGTYFVCGVVRKRVEIEEAETLIKDTAIIDGKTLLQSIPQDPGSAGKSQKKHIGASLDGFNVKIDQESGDKEVRAIGVASQWNLGNVKLVKGPWNAAFLAELATFPRGQFKDQVDALSRAYSELLKMDTAAGGTPEGGEEIGAGNDDAADEDQFGGAVAANDGW